MLPFFFKSPYQFIGQREGRIVSGAVLLPNLGDEPCRKLTVLCHGGVGVGIKMAHLAPILAEAGHVVVIPDYSGIGGSQGNITWAMDEVDDVLAAASHALDTFFPNEPEDAVEYNFFGLSHGAAIALLSMSRSAPRLEAPNLRCGKIVAVGVAADLGRLFGEWRSISANDPEHARAKRLADTMANLWVGKTPEQDPEAYARRSPLRVKGFEQKRLPAEIILIHGGDDTLVKPEHTEQLEAFYLEKGLNATGALVPDRGHDFRKSDLEELVRHYLAH